MTTFIPSHKAISELFQSDSIQNGFQVTSDVKKGKIYLTLEQDEISFPLVIDEIFQKKGKGSEISQKLLKAFNKYKNKTLNASELQRKISTIAIFAADEIEEVIQNKSGDIKSLSDRLGDLFQKNDFQTKYALPIDTTLQKRLITKINAKNAVSNLATGDQALSIEIKNLFNTTAAIDFKRYFKLLKQGGYQLGLIQMPVNSKGDTALHCAVKRQGLQPNDEKGISAYFETIKRLIKKGSDINACDGRGSNAFHIAVTQGDLALIKYLNAKGANINALNGQKETALHLAVTKHNIPVCALLLKLEADQKIKNGNNQTALVLAISLEFAELVSLLIEELKVVPSELFENDQSLSHIAVKFSQPKLFKSLNSLKADLNAKDKDGNTALHIASLKGDLESIKSLLDKGVDIEIQNGMGATALYLVLLEFIKTGDEKHRETAKYLKASKANCNAQDLTGNTILHQVIILMNIKGRKSDWISYLIDFGLDFKLPNNLGQLPLHLACLQIDIELLKVLLPKKIKNLINIQDKQGNTPLHYAIQGHSMVGLKLLMEQKADFRLTNNKLYTLLHAAAYEGFDEALSYLKEKGVDLEAKDLHGCTALHIAALRRKKTAFQGLLTLSADRTVTNVYGKVASAYIDGKASFAHIVKEGDLEGFKQLVALDALYEDSLFQDKTSSIPPHVAARLGYLEILKLLQTLGADLCAAKLDGKNPLHEAAMGGHHELVSFFKTVNANLIDTTDNDGNTALMLAAQEGHFSTVKSLLLHGAYSQTKNRDGWSALALAAAKEHVEIVQFLLRKIKRDESFELLLEMVNLKDATILKTLRKAGFDLEVKDQNRWTIAQYAATTGNEVILQVLKRAGFDLTIRTSDGRSLLHLSIEAYNCNKVVAFLANEKADFEAKDANGSTALDLALENDKIKACNSLITLGAKFAYRGKQGFKAMLEAVAREKLEVLTNLNALGIDINALDDQGYNSLHNAVILGKKSVLLHLQKLRINWQSRTSNGESAAHLAAIHAKTEILECLKALGINIDSPDAEGNTPFHYAALSNQMESMRTLQKLGALVDYKNKAGLTPLHVAVKNGDLALVKELLHLGAKTSVTDNEDRSVLHIAAVNSRHEIVNYFIDLDVNIRDKVKRTPLHYAILNADQPLVQLLKKRGASMTAQDEGDHTALHYAAAADDAKMILFLYSIDPFLIEMRNNEGRTALHIAAEAGKLDNMQALIECKAEVNALDLEGNSPFHLAAAENQEPSMRYLKSKGAFIDKCNKQGQTALHAAIERDDLAAINLLLNIGLHLDTRDSLGKTALQYALNLNKLAIAKILKEKGADINARDDAGRTFMHHAAMTGNTKLIAALISFGASLEAVDKEGKTPLQVALLGNSFDAVGELRRKGASAKGINFGLFFAQCLPHVIKENDAAIECWIELGANINSQNEGGSSLLHIAAELGKTKMMECLKKLGASFEIQDTQSRSPLKVALEKEKLESIRCLKKLGAKFYADWYSSDIVHNIVRSGNVKKLQCFYEIGASLNNRDAFGKTPIEVALAENNLEMVKLLKSFNVDTQGVLGNDAGSSLRYAAGRGDLKAIENLHILGVDLNAVDAEGQTAIHWAASSKQIDAIKLLYRLKANMNFKNYSGNTALHLAAWAGEIEVVKSLCACGADKEIKGSGERTPFKMALEAQKYEVCKILKTSGAIETQKVLDECLINAIKSNSTENVQLFLELGADANACDSAKWSTMQFSALHLAVLNDNLKMITLLKAAGARLEAVDAMKQTPLMLGLVEEKVAAVRHLHSLGAKISLATQHMHKAIKQGNLEMIKCLVACGFDVNNKENTTSHLHDAVLLDLIPIVECLVSLGARLESKDSHGITPLHRAVLNNKINMVKCLHRLGAKIDPRSNSGWTPFMEAAANGFLSMLRLLKQLGADPNATDNSGYTALHSISIRDNISAMECLKECGVDLNKTEPEGSSTAMFLAAINGKLASVMRLHKLGAKINLANKDQFTPFMAAIERGYVDVAYYLGKNGADFYECNKYKNDSLITAVYNDRPDSIRCLHALGYDFNSKAGNAAIKYAEDNSKKHLIPLMLELQISWATVAQRETAFDQAGQHLECEYAIRQQHLIDVQNAIACFDAQRFYPQPWPYTRADHDFELQRLAQKRTSDLNEFFEKRNKDPLLAVCYKIIDNNQEWKNAVLSKQKQKVQNYYRQAAIQQHQDYLAYRQEAQHKAQTFQQQIIRENQQTQQASYDSSSDVGFQSQFDQIINAQQRQMEQQMLENQQREQAQQAQENQQRAQQQAWERQQSEQARQSGNDSYTFQPGLDGYGYDAVDNSTGRRHGVYTVEYTQTPEPVSAQNTWYPEVPEEKAPYQRPGTAKGAW